MPFVCAKCNEEFEKRTDKRPRFMLGICPKNPKHTLTKIQPPIVRFTIGAVVIVWLFACMDYLLALLSKAPGAPGPTVEHMTYGAIIAFFGAMCLTVVLVNLNAGLKLKKALLPANKLSGQKMAEATGASIALVILAVVGYFQWARLFG